VREGLMKHVTAYDLPGKHPEFEVHSPSLEAQVANLADEITYYSHDLDDGLDSGLLSESKLRRDVRIWRQAAARVRRDHGSLPDECRRFFIVRTIIDGQVKDVVNTAERLIPSSGVRTADDVRSLARPLIRYSPERRRDNLQLRKYLYQNLYYNPVVHGPNQRAVKMLGELFRYLLEHPKEMGLATRRRIRREGLERAVCDYLAGMTDRYAMQEHQRLCGVRP
jgi:dGTPase